MKETKFESAAVTFQKHFRLHYTWITNFFEGPDKKILKIEKLRRK